MGYRSLLARVDLRFVSALEEEAGHVACEKTSGLRVHYVQAVMIDQHRLLFDPVGPTLLANLFDNAGADWPWKGLSIKSRPGLSAAGTGYVRHELGAGVLDLRQPE